MIVDEQRKLAAIMFTDMVGYSVLSQRDDKLALELLEEHREILRKVFPKFNGTEIKTIGDAFLVEFNSALEAAQCAIEIQRAFAKRNADAPANRQIELKIGIHIGDVVHRDGDVYGDGVNIASRIESVAGAGGICVSMDVERQIRNAVETRIEKLAPTELKNISVAMDLFRIVLPWERRAKAEGGRKKEEVRASTASSAGVVWTSAVVLAAIAAGLLAYQSLQTKRVAAPRQSEAGTVVPNKSIAVLPFVDMSQGHDQEYFCDGISEELLDALAQVEGLRVVARTSSFAFKGKSAEVNEIAQKLNVATVLEGSLRRAGDKIRITAQLINGSTGFHIWSETYERDVKDVFAVQDEITRAIVDALKIKLAVAPAIPAAQNPESHDLYLQGLYFANRSDEQSLRKALGLFEQAVEKDPSSSRAWTGVARVWEALADEYLKPLDAYPQAKAAAAKAIALDERNAEAHCWFGVAISVLDWDVQGYEREVKRALEIDPNSQPAHQNAAALLIIKGDDAGAAAEGEKAMQLDPLSPNAIVWAVWPYAMLGRLDDVLAATKRLHELDPNFALASGALPYTYLHLKRYDEAAAAYLEAQEITHKPFAGLAVTYVKMGRREDARRVLNQLLEKARAGYYHGTGIAEVYAALGENDEAFQWLERAFTERDANLLNLLQFSPLRPLYPDPRFVDLVRRLHLDSATASRDGD
jgi:TolB-like protein/class 3 adenylate cyclase/Tfp pilus assembly protein PilF